MSGSRSHCANRNICQVQSDTHTHTPPKRLICIYLYLKTLQVSGSSECIQSLQICLGRKQRSCQCFQPRACSASLGRSSRPLNLSRPRWILRNRPLEADRFGWTFLATGVFDFEAGALVADFLTGVTCLTGVLDLLLPAISLKSLNKFIKHLWRLNLYWHYYLHLSSISHSNPKNLSRLEKEV